MKRFPKALRGKYLIAAVPDDPSLMPVFWVASAAWNSDPTMATMFRDEDSARLEIVSGSDQGRFNDDVRPYSLEKAMDLP